MPRDPLLRSVTDRLYWIAAAAATVVCVTLFEVLTLGAGARRRERYARLVRWWGRLLLLGHRIEIEGGGRIPRGEALLFVSNHQGNLDIPLLHAVLPVTFRWVARHDLFGVPFLGRAMRRMEGIEIVRGDRRSSLAALRQAVDALRAGQNVIVFPEGTWGDVDGRMLPLREGVVSIASRARVRVVPLTIVGSHLANPPRTRRVRPARMRVIVHEPWPVGSCDGVEPAAWLARLRTEISAPLPHGAAPAEVPARAVANH